MMPKCFWASVRDLSAPTLKRGKGELWKRPL